MRISRGDLSRKHTADEPVRFPNTVVIVGFSLCMAAQMLPVYSSLNATFDEGYHLGAALEFVQERTYVYGVEQPPLQRWLTAVLPTLEGVRFRRLERNLELPSEDMLILTRMSLEEQGSYWKTLTLARLGTLPFVVLLIAYVWLWSRELSGTKGAILSTALVTFSPNLLAHGSLATVDFAAAATILPAAYYCARWATNRGDRDAIPAALFTGIAVVTKYSALPYLGLTLILYLLFACRSSFRDPMPWGRIRRHAPRQLAIFASIVFVVSWASFAFEARTMTDPSRRPYERIDRIFSTGTSAHAAAYWFAETVPLPLLDMAKGLILLRHHAAQGHEAFLLGERYRSGRFAYFPVVIATKTTIPFLVLITIGLWSLMRMDTSRAVFPALAAISVLTVAVVSPINIGVRHILPVFPFLALLAGAGLPRARRLQPFVLGLLVWHAGEALHASPDFIPYFNQSVRGSEDKVLGDSNLDWGQDLYRLQQFMAEQGIDEISLNYFGTTSPEALGIHATPFTSADRPSGWVAASVTQIQGIYEAPLTWLSGHEPVAKAGRSIYIYNIP